MALIVASAALLAACRQPEPAGPCAVVAGPTSLPDIPEASGLAVSRRTPGVLWSHNDSGHAAVLFALDTAGRTVGRVAVPIQTRDWEDVSAAACPGGDCLYIADIGDNAQARRRIYIHRVPEPLPGAAATAPVETFEATYADGPHNAEALFVSGADLFIVTKDRVGGLYHAALPPAPGRALRFERIGELGLELVTDAESSRDGKSLVVRTPHEAAFYRMADVAGGRPVAVLRVPLDGVGEAQGEGVALDGDVLFLASEGRPWTWGGSVSSLRCAISSVM